MFDKLYGQTQNKAMLASVLDDLSDDFRKIESMVSPEAESCSNSILRWCDPSKKRSRAVQLSSGEKTTRHPVPQLEPNVEEQNDNMPLLCKMQMDLLLSLVNDFTRIATFQITNSVGNAKMKWLILMKVTLHSHEPDSNEEAYEQLIQINMVLRASRLLRKRLSETPEPGGEGSMLDHTTLVWTNELGKGNSHTRNDIPFVMVARWTRFQNGTSYPQSCSSQSITHEHLRGDGIPNAVIR